MIQPLFKLRTLNQADLAKVNQVEFYTVIYIEDGTGSFEIDGGTYSYIGPSIIFMAPFQEIYLKTPKNKMVTLLEFHGDFYCIEFHKAEVACNGLLFNNIFLTPHIDLTSTESKQVQALLNQIKNELKNKASHDRSVLTAYLQLFLAICSRMKKQRSKSDEIGLIYDKGMLDFKRMVDEKFLEFHKPSDYAKALKISSNDLAKRCKKAFRKSPSSLINERIVLEAKKKLHLTRMSVKEVAFELLFKDEYYFSRFFKKSVGLSPLKFRKKVGISIVADSSKL